MKLLDKNYYGHSFIHNESYNPGQINNNYDWKCSNCGCLCLFAGTNMNNEIYYLREGYMNYLLNNIVNDKCIINYTCNEYIIKLLLE